jgi:hypothetical protein
MSKFWGIITAYHEQASERIGAYERHRCVRKVVLHVTRSTKS